MQVDQPIDPVNRAVERFDLVDILRRSNLEATTRSVRDGERAADIEGRALSESKLPPLRPIPVCDEPGCPGPVDMTTMLDAERQLRCGRDATDPSGCACTRGDDTEAA